MRFITLPLRPLAVLSPWICRGCAPELLTGAEMVERHAERSEASCHVLKQIPRCARNDNVQHFPLGVVSCPPPIVVLCSDRTRGGLERFSTVQPDEDCSRLQQGRATKKRAGAVAIARWTPAQLLLSTLKPGGVPWLCVRAAVAPGLASTRHQPSSPLAGMPPRRRARKSRRSGPSTSRPFWEPSDSPTESPNGHVAPTVPERSTLWRAFSPRPPDLSLERAGGQRLLAKMGLRLVW